MKICAPSHLLAIPGECYLTFYAKITFCIIQLELVPLMIHDSSPLQWLAFPSRTYRFTWDSQKVPFRITPPT